MFKYLRAKWRAGSATTWFFCVRHWLWPLLAPRFIILLGPPGIGKGTLAGRLATALGIRQMSPGDAFRREKAANTALAKVVSEAMASGGLVQDDITMEVVRRELTRPRYWRGGILDGVPRNLAQAKLLQSMLEDWGCSVALVVSMEMDEADEEKLIDRLENRLTCSNKSCGRTYNLKSDPPRQAGCCDLCSSHLYRRADDVRAVIQQRLATFRRETRPVTGFYKGNDSLLVVKPISMTKAEVLAAVLSRLSPAKK